MDESIDDDDSIKYIIYMVFMKNIEEKKKRKREGSKVDHLCISRIRPLGHEMLMKDYFAE
jgi:hypothetical protein